MKWVKILIILICCLSVYPAKAKATDNVMEEQKDLLNNSDLVDEANRYSKEAFPDVDIGEILNSAITGKVDTSFFYNVITGILGKEVMSAVRVLRFYTCDCCNT